MSSTAHHHHHHAGSSASASASTSTPTPPIPTAPLLHPPPLFAPVAPSIYRSATPPPSSHAFLATLQLRTIISLTSELPSSTLQTFARKNGVRFVHFGPSASAPRCGQAKASEGAAAPPPFHPFSLTLPMGMATSPIGYSGAGNPTSTETLKDSLELVLSRCSHPVLVTDTSGMHEVGILVACLRKLQRWNFATILVEYRNFAGNRARAAHERLIEMFDTDLITLPPHDDCPAWLSEQVEWDEREVDASRESAER